MLRSSSTKAIVGMSLLSKVWLERRAIQRCAAQVALNPVNEQCKLG
jgi:hypothetical protein